MSGCGPAGQKAGPTLARALRLGLSVAAPRLPTHHWKILRALLACRTPLLGGHRYLCQQCGRTHFVPHSCRNRHCPLCQGQAAHRWLEQQQSALLPVPYFHLVFTLPHALNPLIRQNQRALYTLLFQAASQTLLQFGRNRFGAQLGLTAVLHTWSQTLMDHYHLHCVVSGGGLSSDGCKWVSASPHFLFSVRALSKVFRAKFCAGLQQLYRAKKLRFEGQLKPLAEPKPFAQLLRQATRQKWVVYSKRPFAGPQQVLAYLSRYTHRVAISPSRLLAVNGQDRTVTFVWKDYAQEARHKTMTLGAGEFARRFCLHLLPRGFTKIRHFGFLANRGRLAKLTRIRALLQARAPVEPTQSQDNDCGRQAKASPGRVCPHCGSDRLWLFEVIPPSFIVHVGSGFDSS